MARVGSFPLARTWRKAENPYQVRAAKGRKRMGSHMRMVSLKGFCGKRERAPAPGALVQAVETALCAITAGLKPGSGHKMLPSAEIRMHNMLG